MNDVPVLIVGAILASMTFLVLVLLVILLVRRSHDSPAEWNTALQTLQQQQMQLAELKEKMAWLQPLNQGLQGLNVEVRSLVERVGVMEKNQSNLQSGVGNLSVHSGSALAELRVLTGGIAETASSLRGELARAQNDLSGLQANTHARQEAERQTAESIRRLEAIIAGVQSKGAAGENILDAVFSRLPAEWQVRNFRLGGKTVEFGLRLPNQLILPIDSKWTATHTLEQFLNSQDTEEMQRLKKEIETAVYLKAREVTKYIDPNLTTPFGLAVVPDAVYDLSSAVQPLAFQMNVAIISYSLFVPYLLLVFHTILKTSQTTDLQKLDAYIQSIQTSLQAIQEEMDGRLARGITMIENSRDELRSQLGRASTSVAGVKMSTHLTELPPAVEEERAPGEPVE